MVRFLNMKEQTLMSKPVERGWGTYTVLEEADGYKLKELTVYPNHCISYQKHELRSEIWFVKEGYGKLILNDAVLDLTKFSSHHIMDGEWHQLVNGSKNNLVILEIQYGINCDEEDITRQ